MNGTVRNNKSGNFIFLHISPQSYPNVLDHLIDNYFVDEPVNKLFGLSPDREADIRARFTTLLNEYPKSWCAVPKDQPDVIAAVLIIRFHDVNSKPSPYTPKSSITREYNRFLEQAVADYNVHKHYGIPRFPELATVSVDKNFRGYGLATELYRRGMEQLFEEGYPLVYSEFSNPYSRRVGDKLGFKEMARFYFKDFKNPDGGLSQLPGAEDQFLTLTVFDKDNWNIIL